MRGVHTTDIAARPSKHVPSRQRGALRLVCTRRHKKKLRPCQRIKTSLTDPKCRSGTTNSSCGRRDTGELFFHQRRRGLAVHILPPLGLADELSDKETIRDSWIIWSFILRERAAPVRWGMRSRILDLAGAPRAVRVGRHNRMSIRLLEAEIALKRAETPPACLSRER